MKTGLILSVIWIFSVATAYPQERVHFTGSDVDDQQIKLKSVGVDDSQISFEIPDGISEESVSIVYGDGLIGIQNPPIPKAELKGLFPVNHSPDVAWPHPGTDSDSISASFQSQHPVATGYPIPSEDFIIETIGARMIWVESGTFIMGAPELEAGIDSDETQHSVTLTKGYWLGQTEVTQAQWAGVMGTNPSRFRGGGQLPVEGVSWGDCIEFCRRLTESERRAGRISDSMSYTLPTEAQWEYACRERGAATGPFHYGNSLNSNLANCIGSYPYGPSLGQHLGRTMEVKTYTPNALGLYDMHGNVWEWCSDWYGGYPIGAVTDPAGPSSGSDRVYRGGSCHTRAWYCRSAFRSGDTPSPRLDESVGFRLSLQTGEIDDQQINLRIVNIGDSQISFEIQDGISEGSVEIVFGAGLIGLQNSPIPLAELNGPFPANHKFDVAWSHPDFDSDPRSAFFQAHHRVDTGDPIASKDFVIESIGARMIWVEPGTFLMGASELELGRVPGETQHLVTLTRGFWLGQTEVTQAQWVAVMGTNPSRFRGRGQLPVEQVSWDDCMEFCRRLTESERQAGRISGSMSYTLPTESQWEYACRECGSATGPFHYGNSLISDQANFNGDFPYRDATNGPNLKRTTEVKTYTTNALLLYDMHGNVSEWCSDWYGDYPTGAVTDPVGPSMGSRRVNRGGSWIYGAGRCRSANRGYDEWQLQLNRYDYVGFRLSLQTVE